jgi:hypothetical protein
LSDQANLDLAVIGNCQIAALIAAEGSIVWAFVPASDHRFVSTVNALAAIGRLDEARALFGRLLSRRNRVGLLSEDIDPVTGELWGNFPQSYSMVGIIISAQRLSRYWEDVV